MALTRIEGKVVDFDAHRGIGEIEDSEGNRRSFHCVEIVDGTRMVDVGTSVTFEVVPGLLGRWEAAKVDKT